MKKFFYLFFLVFLNITGQPNFPTLKNYANDFTSTLSNSELYTLNSALKTFDDSTSSQVVFLMIRSIEGYSLEMYTYEVASRNKIGSTKNNGVLFFVAKDDRKIRIEVGYGLEGALPDALASSILRNEVRPYFKHNEYYAGISAGLDAIMKAIKGEYTSDKKKDDKDGIGFPIMYIILILIFIIFSGRKGGRGGGGGLLPWLIISSMGSGRSKGGWGSGGFGGFSGGGGGFGGFSGGGGSFGGGGASGSW